MGTIRLRSLGLVLWILAALASARQDPWVGWPTATPTVEEVQAQKERVQAYARALPTDAAEGSVDARLAASAGRREQLLAELEATLVERAGLTAGGEGRAAREQQLAETLRELRAAPRPTRPGDATVEGFDRLQEVARAKREQVAAQRAALEGAADLAEAAPGLRANLAERTRAARERVLQLAQAPPENEVELRKLQSANAELDQRVAQELEATLQARFANDALLDAGRRLELRIAEAELERLDEELALHSAALTAEFESQRSTREAELEAKRRLAEESADPYERFVAGLQLEIAVSESSVSEAHPIQLEVASEISEQEERLANDRRELERLQLDCERSGTTGAVGRAIQQTFRQLPQRRQTIEYAVQPRHEAHVVTLSDRRFEVDQLLYGLRDAYRARLEEALAGRPASARRRLEAEAEELRDALHDQLQTERRVLTDAIGSLREIRRLKSDRLRTLEELETFLHAQVFWIQGAPALAPISLDAYREELAQLTGDELRGEGRTALADLRALARRPQQWAPGLLVLLGLPLVTAWLRSRLRRFLARLELEHGRGPWGGLVWLLAGAVQALMMPLCLAVVIAYLPRAGLGAVVEPVLSVVLKLLAGYSLLRGSGRVFFGEEGLTSRLGFLPKTTALELRDSLRAAALALPFLLLPSLLLEAPPFELELLPRVFLVGFACVTCLAVFRAFHGNSGVLRAWLGGDPGTTALRASRAWSVLLALVLCAVPVLEFTGRRYAASTITASLAWTMVAALALPIVHRLVLPILLRFFVDARPPKRRLRGAAEAELQKDKKARRKKLVAAVRVVFVLVGFVLLVRIWGINERAWSILQDWHLYQAGVHPVDGTPRWVAAGDIVLALSVMLSTAWLLRHLPGIYDVAVFPRFDLDRGLRYAIVTISRYGLFFLGVVFTVNALRLDLENLGWLVAAMGIGLGFGLQEIVSNFVSGLILLVERPIRPGDMVTANGTIGVVQRINIRATTILSQERQEVIVPNRSLIAQDVVNWTLETQILRITTRIGIAYGSDVDAAREVLREAAVGTPGVLPKPAPEILFMQHGESSLDFDVRVFLSGPEKRFAVMDALNTRINKALAQSGFEIPFPQRDLHMRSGWSAAQSPTRS